MEETRTKFGLFREGEEHERLPRPQGYETGSSLLARPFQTILNRKELGYLNLLQRIDNRANAGARAQLATDQCPSFQAREAIRYPF
jgi:hypothetical protein